MSVSNVYVTDMIKGRRYPPEMRYLEKLIDILKLTPEEWEEMLDIAGRERQEVAPDLPEYLMSEEIPHVRVTLRHANDKHLGDDFSKTVNITVFSNVTAEGNLLCIAPQTRRTSVPSTTGQTRTGWSVMTIGRDTT
jgi:hypothetical protein